MSVRTKVAVADPCLLAKQKFQPTLLAFVNCLPTWSYVGLYVMLVGTFILPKFLADGG